MSWLLPDDLAAERAHAKRHAGSRQLARRLGDDVDHAVHRVGAPDGRRRPADHFDLLDLGGVDRQEVPGDEPEEVQVDAAAVDQRQLAGRQRRRGAAAGEVDVAGRGLGDVEPGHRPEQVGVAGGGVVLQGLAGNQAHRGRRVHQRLLGLGGRDDDLLLVDRRLLGRWHLLGFLFGLLRGGRRGRRLSSRGWHGADQNQDERAGKATLKHRNLLVCRGTPREDSRQAAPQKPPYCSGNWSDRGQTRLKVVK